MSLKAAVLEVKREINSEIAKLEGLRNALDILNGDTLPTVAGHAKALKTRIVASGKATKVITSKAVSKKPKGGITEEARMKISEAQKKRWAQIKKKRAAEAKKAAATTAKVAPTEKK